MMTAVALHYLELGYRPIPLIRHSKRSAVKWAEYRARPPTEQEIRSWFRRGPWNVGLLTGNGVCVVDVDDRSLVGRVLKGCGDTPMRCRTPNGMHLYYAAPAGVPCGNRVRIHNLPVDVRGDGAYVVCPWSRDARGVPYEWVGDIVPASELPPINAARLEETTPKRHVTPIILPDSGRPVRRARRYLAHIEGAISGQRGHDRTFRVACVLAIKFGLTHEQAWPLFLEWNRQCEPPWSEKELHHKLQDAFKQRSRFLEDRSC